MRQRTLNVGGVERSYHVSVPAGHTGASPVIVALPFKLLVFVLVDGWTLLIGSLVKSFALP